MFCILLKDPFSCGVDSDGTRCLTRADEIGSYCGSPNERTWTWAGVLCTVVHCVYCIALGGTIRVECKLSGSLQSRTVFCCSTVHKDPACSRLVTLEMVRRGLIKTQEQKKICSLIVWISAERNRRVPILELDRLFLIGSMLSFYIPYSKQLNNSLNLLKWLLYIFHPPGQICAIYIWCEFGLSTWKHYETISSTNGNIVLFQKLK